MSVARPSVGGPQSGLRDKSRLANSLITACVGLTLLPVNGFATIEEVVVTTRKREESLQDVPIAVTALSREQLERQNIANIADITKLSPSVVFDRSFGPADTRITIRGLSNTRGRSNVAFLVDGIDVTTETLLSAGSGLLANRRLLNDLERVEVVKGPQSALYGRAAFAGAISYVTRDPADALEAQVRMDVADDGLYEIGALFGGPVFSDAFGLSLNGVYWSDDGRFTNSVSAQTIGGGDGYAAAVTGTLTPGEIFRLKARVEYSSEEYDVLPFVRVGGGTQGQHLVLATYPESALDAGLGQSTTNFLSLVDHGQYCPDGLRDPSRGPGFCLPTTFGGADGQTVTLSEDPVTGGDYRGTSTDLLRASLVASLDFGFGSFSSLTGWTDFRGDDSYDQDYQADGRPDMLLSNWETTTVFKTRQFSQELRYSSNWDSRVQLTAGGLYWKEDRDLDDLSPNVLCMPGGKRLLPDGGIMLIDAIAGICDGTGGSVDSWQEMSLQLKPQPHIPWRADTRHLSFYGMLEWSFAAEWKLTLEDRYVDEDFDILRPNQGPCTPIGAGVLTVPFIVLEREMFHPVTGEILNDVVCTAIDDSPANTYMLIDGSTSSSFHVPKVTVEWAPTDDMLFYSYWATARKPGGINQLSPGGSPVTIEEERFDPEKMDTYEVGAKTSWNAAGDLVLNGALFLNDYTNKQVGTQVLVEDQLQPRIINASAAEVWGLELNAAWRPAFFEGLYVEASYTYLDATYTDFEDDTTSVLRAAMAGQCPVVYKGGAGPDPGNLADPANGSPFCRLDLSGKRLERTPEHALVGLFGIQRPLDGAALDWFFEFNATWQDERFVSADNFVQWDAYWLTDFRLGIAGENWEILGYIDNVFDDDTFRSGGSGPDFGRQVSELGFVAGFGVGNWYGPLPDPRRFGIRLNLNWGG